MKSKGNCLGFFFLAALSIWMLPMNPSSAQVSEAWIARYHGALGFNDIAWDIEVDDRGQVYVTGRSDNNYLTIKYDSNGVALWTVSFNSSGLYIDEAKALAVDAQGFVYVTGFCYDTQWGITADYGTIKYDSAGNTQWIALYDGPAGWDDWAKDVAVDDSGNVYVTGYSFDSTSQQDYATIKYNAAGQEQWVARYDSPMHNSDDATHVEITQTGEIVVVGSTTGLSGWSNITTIKYDPAGQMVWCASFNGAADRIDVPSDLKLDAQDNIYIAGTTDSGHPFLDFVALKYNLQGELEWAVSYNGPGNWVDSPSALAVDRFGSVYLTGGSWDSLTQHDYATVKYDSQGVLQWVVRYDGPNHEQDLSAAVVVDSMFNVYVTGTIDGWDNFVEGDYGTIKYDSYGQEQWLITYDDSLSLPDVPHAMTLDQAGNIYVTGASSGIGYFPSYWLDYLTIKYTQSPSGVQPQTNPALPPAPFSVQSLHPNPFNSTTTLRLTVQQPDGITIQLFNLFGQSLGFVQERKRLEVGNYHYEIDGSDWASGVYLYSISSGNYSLY